MSETEAVRRLQAGDRSALNLLYSTYAEAAIRTAFLITRSKAVAEDAVQEAFVQVIRTVPTLRDPASFRPWFYRIVVNSAKRLSRNISRSLPLDLEYTKVDLTALSPDEAAIGIEEIQMVRAAINDLNQAHREAVILRYYTDLSEDEIAQSLGVPSGTVKSRLHRAKEVLRERLEGKTRFSRRSAVPLEWSSGQKE
ncbi:MAG: RNA polymerase sigma factor [Bacillota bacterium]